MIKGRKADAGHDGMLGSHANHESTCTDLDAFLSDIDMLSGHTQVGTDKIQDKYGTQFSIESQKI